MTPDFDTPKPIWTAPRDRTIIGFIPGGSVKFKFMQWYENNWRARPNPEYWPKDKPHPFDAVIHPTHWLELDQRGDRHDWIKIEILLGII